MCCVLGISLQLFSPLSAWPGPHCSGREKHTLNVSELWSPTCCCCCCCSCRLRTQLFIWRDTETLQCQPVTANGSSGRCRFALFAVKPNQLLRLKAAGQAISSSFCLVWMGLRGEAQQLRFWVSFSFRNMKLQDVTVLSFYGSPVCQFTHQTDSQWKCYPKYPVNWWELMYKP